MIRYKSAVVYIANTAVAALEEKRSASFKFSKPYRIPLRAIPSKKGV
ncbi:MAG: hypothetical protein ACTHMD_04250 [Flavisolibacter sp.]